MSLRKASPGEGGGNTRVHFRYVGVGHSKTWAAHCAGPCQWYMCHTSERSKPCLDWITHGVLPCPRCGGAKEAVMMGYQPIYRSSDGCPVMVVLYEDQRDHADKLDLHERVMVGREGEKGDAVYIRRAMEQTPKYQTTLGARMFAADITETCLVMWKIPELVEWYRAQPKASDTGVSLPKGTAITSAGKPYSPMMQQAAKLAGAEVVADDFIAATLGKSLNRVKAAEAAMAPPHTNGKPKPR